MNKAISPFTRFFLFSLFLFSLLQSSAYSGELSFSWTPNTDASLAGYKIYYGSESRNYNVTIDVGNPAIIDGKVTYTVQNLPEGNTLYFAATAYDNDGLESNYSEEVICSCPVSANADPSTNELTTDNLTDSEMVLATILTDAVQEEISDTEETDLQKIWLDHKISRDLYQAYYKMWGSQTFINTVSDEQHNMDAVVILLEKYELTVPEDVAGVFDSQDDQDLYDLMFNAGSASTEESLRLGATMEDMIICELQNLLIQTDNVDIQTIYQNALKSARNHLRLFVALLSQAEINYEPLYLSAEDFAAIISSSIETGIYDENGEALFEDTEWLNFTDNNEDGTTDLVEVIQMYEEEDLDSSSLQGLIDGRQTYLTQIRKFQILNKKYLKTINTKKLKLAKLKR
ncbi:MAG: DUF2202 domain-containing protein [Proteobacteria bacterium]|nr:DUF2202 domain-containing protein [Pseudomonadota bacterium]MBU0967627.1 DUF2202 domain-containing protein [Pseudomonadota bacterium]